MAFPRSALPLIFLSVAGLFLCYSFSNGGSIESEQDRVLRLQVDPKTVTKKSSDNPLLIVLNTPKSGTGGLTSTFTKSHQCWYKKKPKVKEFAKVSTSPCEDATILRSHEPAETAVAARYHHKPDLKCLIATAIRSPETWLPSLFMQQNSGALCHTTLTIKDFTSKYKAWLVGNSESIREIVNLVRPGLLEDYGTNLTDVMETVNKNNGYSLLSNASPSSGFDGCELLFLSMEYNSYWPDIFASVLPGTIHKEYHQDRVGMCPEIADHYKAIQSYKLTKEERAVVINNDQAVEEYFSVYGL